MKIPKRNTPQAGASHRITVQGYSNRRKTVIIKKTDHSVEKVLRSCVVLAPKSKSRKEVEKSLKPTKATHNYQEHPTREDTKLKYIVTGDDEEDNTDKIDHAEETCKERRQKKDPKDDDDYVQGCKYNNTERTERQSTHGGLRD